MQNLLERQTGVCIFGIREEGHDFREVWASVSFLKKISSSNSYSYLHDLEARVKAFEGIVNGSILKITIAYHFTV